MGHLFLRLSPLLPFPQIVFFPPFSPFKEVDQRGLSILRGHNQITSHSLHTSF